MDIRPRESYDHGPVGPALDLTRVTGVDLHHTAGGWTAGVHNDLKALAAQTRRKFGRSSYNYAIHPHTPDVVWEMQGLHIGAHNDGENSTRLGLVVLGNYQTVRPSDRIVATAGRFVGHAHTSGWTTRLHVKGHRDTDATSCPGQHLYARLPDIRTIATEDDMNDEQDARLRNIERMVADQLRPTLTRIDGNTRAIHELARKIAAGDTLTDAEIAQVIRDAAKDIDVNVTVTPSE